MTTDRPRPAVLDGEGVDRLTTSGVRIVLVGAGGWLGLATLELLHRLLGEAFGARVICFGSSARSMALRGGFNVTQRPLKALADLAPEPTIVLHLAFLTQEKAMAMPAGDYVATNRFISDTVLGALDVIGARAIFVPSSGAVYSADDPSASIALRLYGDLKLRDEGLFVDWASKRGGRAVVSRIFNLAGPYINKVSSYALACFILDALADRPIRVRADRPVYRSYVAIRELMSIVFAELTEETSGYVTFDTAGDRALEMAEIALAVADALGRERSIVRPPLTEWPPDRYLGDGDAYQLLRGRYGVTPVDLREQILETANFLGSAQSGARAPS